MKKFTKKDQIGGETTHGSRTMTRRPHNQICQFISFVPRIRWLSFRSLLTLQAWLYMTISYFWNYMQCWEDCFAKWKPCGEKCMNRGSNRRARRPIIYKIINKILKKFNYFLNRPCNFMSSLNVQLLYISQ